ncbi:putative leucine-rich repeat-containing protein DDB_G0290503 isoform X2 [Achroia grisella]|uniref:putative leucine-rich repeat-containing protein DDB_G0290503 isoform X2 n=1 Tax=Achroia grisella TaxID=688607 RepID=UPI0027D29D88|nr:putative leucine-rich repeat-containing protein DDB_G0290503 isoform X2 [Achroia grisella]
MLQKWKNILINWVNCYFNTSNNKQQDINVQSLLNIISHLRENLNLDDSKSSVLEAHTIEEFILEKYPEFKFKNGTIEPTTQEEIYVVASLLLFFVCVISKDVDIKNAMCSKLSADDQEVILKFSKSLMECHLISYRDVQTAITACGQEVASAHSSHSIISATPPALRSLHSEVRRLQAALDAERFDRNYLQEELARMNMKLEKLLKDKEKYKLDIVNLKAKISMCCGQETEQPGVNAVTEGSLKLTRQLQQLEERLVETQGQLDDAFYERDTYKTKVDTLKQERDKWLAVSQQETSQVIKLSEELEVERQQVQSLQDLVTELRQHNQLNRFDSSQLECDDPDTSIRSIQHNSSICSEVCANVVEVQLGEERAKIVALKQQLQTLQDQLNELNQKSEQDKQAMELIICEKESEIVNLKHRVNEELEEQNNLKSHFNDEISKLNNEINEMEQQLKYNTEQSRRVLEKKMDEIRILQEEKISLLHSLSDETTKLDNIIKSLRTDLDTEKNTKISMKEEYENHIMKLNEKVLNRNNELVELQNNLLQNSEQLEYLHAEVRKERQIKQDLINKHCMELQQFNEKQNLTDNILKQKTNEIEQLQKKLELNLTCTEKLHNDISNLELKISDLGDNCRSLEDNKLALLQEIRNRDAKIEEIQKEVENVDNIFKEEQEKWLFEKDEKSVTINALQMQLQNEIDFKMQLQNELTQLQNNRISLLDNVNRLNLELEDSKKELEIKEQTIVGMDIYLHEEKQKNVKMTKENDELQEKVKVMSDDIAVKEIITKDIENILLEKKRFYEDEIRNKDALIECEHHKLVDALEEKNTVQSELISITNEKQKLEKELNEKYTEVLQFKAEYTKMIQIVEEKNSTIGALTTKSEQHAISLKAMETSAICNETELKEARDNICMLKQQIKSLQDQLEKSSKKSKHDRHEMELCISEKETDILNLKHHINKVSEEKSKIEVITKDEVTKLNSKLNELELKHKESIKEFTHVIETKTHELKVVQEEKMSLLKNLSHENNKLEEIVKTLKVDFDVERNAKISMNEEYENRITSLNQTILDRNNELVELQNNLFEKTEMLEKLHIEIKRESQRNLDISNKHHDELESLCEQRLHMQNILDQKVQELEQLEKKLQEYATYTEELNNQNNDLKSTITSLKQNCKNLEENKSTLIFEMKNRDSKIEEIENIRKEVEFENNVFRQEKEKWLCDKDEKNVTLNDLQMQLENEVQFKIQLQKELNHSQKNNSSLLEDMTNLNLELSNLKQDVEIKNQTIVEMELNLEKEKNINEGLKTNYNRLQEEAQILTKEVNAKDIIIAEMQNTIEEEKKYFENEILKREKLLESEHQQLLVVLEEKNTIKAELTSVVNDKNTLEKTENHKCTEIMQLKEELKKMKELLEENKSNVSSEISAKKEIEQHLAQERANIDLLKQQVQTLQDELIKSCKTREDETQAMELVISEKQSQLNNLKYHIDEEIEEKNMVKIKFNDLISKLNTEINELQQKLKDDTQQSLKIIDTKVEEVKILQQEKLCLIQKLSDETTKRDSIIQSMKGELKRELNSKASMEEEYENQIIKLNEIVSNTHNKVMELQKNISKNSEELEQVREALRKERQLNQDLTDKYYMELKELNKQKMHTDNILEQKVVECEQFQKELQQSVAYSEELNKNVSDLKMTISQLNENCKILEDNKLTLLLEVKDRDAAVEKNRKEIDNTNTKWLQDKDENNVTINALQMQLKNELFIKMQLQKELTDLQKVRGSLLSDINLLNLEHTKIKKEIENNYQTINEKEQQLKEEQLKNEKLKTDHEELQEKVRIISQDITTKDIALKVVKEEKTSYEDEILKKDALLEFEQQKLLDVLEEKSAVQAELISVMKEKVALEKDISQKGIEVLQLKEEYAKLMQILEENRLNTDNKLLDVTKELEVSKENCQQLSTQLKRIVHQKNEEIAELKKQVSKMSVTENRATQIIKVSSKYQAIILKRIAEIKNNTVLKELTNFGNSANCDNEVRRSLYAGTITMEDLENFLETTEKHLRRCSEKQIALQKERDRLTDVNRINESEVINLKKFLTELAVGYKTFCNIKDLYAQKLSRIVTVQRTVRREILNLDGRITEATMCKLERGYAAVMQDLSECSLNMQRWIERSIDRTISPEKIQQAFTCENDRVSLASMSFQNNSLDIQLEEMEKSFQKLLEEVLRAQKGEGAKDAQSVTMMEIRAEYEDKLNRMKAKMKELYHEQIAVFQSRQKEEIAALEHELQKSKQKLLESSRAYEEHIKSLTTELWTVGEKFLMKQDEAEWLRKKQRYGSLMSLQHVHSSGLMPTQEVPSRPSDTHSLRSLPAFNNNTNGKREGRGLHMSDEEGEVFDNRCLKELSSTPRRSPPPGLRLSELRWRNSLCPPHLKSSYPAETQFASAIDEDDIKCSTMINGGGRPQRKEVGITAYKKPGPPTPSKQAGRLSATDSELRESLRVEMDPQAQASRKTSTPSRFRAFFRSARHDISDGTPRKRSSIFRKK